MKKLFVVIALLWAISVSHTFAQSPYNQYFEEAYERYPSIPKGLLESVAWTQTRMQHVKPAGKSCSASLPAYHGVMGLVELQGDLGQFKSTLDTVVKYAAPDFTRQQIISDPRANILAYAKVLAKKQQNKRLASGDVTAFKDIIAELSEIPDGQDAVDQFAHDQQFYAVLKQIESPAFSTNYRLAKRNIDYEKVFGKENFQILSATRIEISNKRISSENGHLYRVTGGDNQRTAGCDAQNSYFGSIWVPAHSRNYRKGRSGHKPEFITIHTIQGSYASAISWFKNPMASVSAHYIIRSFDGQVTQMVCDADKGIHVKGRNRRTSITYNNTAVGIEHEGFVDEGGSWYSSAMYESSAAVVKDLCQRHNIDPKKTYQGPSTKGVNYLGDQCTKIKGHQHFYGNDHVDPGVYWDWDRYYRLINGEPELESFTDADGSLFDSGGENKNYGDLERKAYLIEPRGASLVELSFEVLDTEAGYDMLEIYDGENRNGVLLGKFSGNKIPDKFTARSGKVYIEFRSDCQFNHQGWKINYTSDKSREKCPAPEKLMVPDNSLTALTATLKWDKVRKADYYQVYLIRRGVPGAKALLFKPKGEAVTVTGLAADAPYQWQIEAVCGQEVSARTGQNFTTSPISFSSKPKQYIIPLNSGRFYDSGGKEQPYRDQEEYAYTIVPSDGGKVQIKFLQFETEDGLDELRVYDGKNARSRLLGKFSGKKSPGTITSSDNGLTLVFTSDKRTTAKGWEAVWRSVGGSGADDENGQGATVVDTDPGDNGSTGNGSTGNGSASNNTGGSISLPTAAFSPELSFSNDAPETRPKLKSTYKESFTLSFNDKERGGRGVANRFYSLMTYSNQGYRGVSDKGFLFDDFSSDELHPEWKSVKGSWQVRSNRLAQMDAKEQNSNLYAEVRQNGQSTYLYHWVGRMSGGDAENRRFGLHFFCSDPKKPDRGNSYFVWIREGGNDDQIEIYEVINDEFKMRAKADVKLDSEKTYDYKVVYNPQKGRMEVYLNNRYVTYWVDPSPLRTGKAISLRTGGCVAEYDDIQIFQNRGESIKLSLGRGAGNAIRVASPDRQTDAFRVSSLIVAWGDRLQWSPITTEGARAELGEGPSIADNGNANNTNSSSNNNSSSGSGGSASSSGNTSSGSGSSSTAGTSTGNNGSSGAARGEESNRPKPSFNTPLSKRVWLGSAYQGDFVIDFPLRSGIKNRFILVSDHDGKNWGANDQHGFLYDDFPGPLVDPAWKQAVGDWKINRFGNLKQADASATNGNLYHLLRQTGNTTYLYHFQARLLSRGDNKRFGIHFFCSDARQPNRGDSYFVWLRNNDSKADKIEIYRSQSDVLEKKRSATIDIQPDQWYDIKVLYDAVYGKIEIYLDNQIALAWQDPLLPLKGGRYLSLRTGSAEVLFDDVRVYRLYEDRFLVRVGNPKTDMFRHKSKGGKAAGQIFSLEQSRTGEWYQDNRSETQVK
jgi:N-acetyl-anhydromuramyl-L-alanine amidase AmpD